MEVDPCDKVVKGFGEGVAYRDSGPSAIFSSSWPLALSCSHVEGKCRSTPRTGGGAGPGGSGEWSGWGGVSVHTSVLWQIIADISKC